MRGSDIMQKQFVAMKAFIVDEENDTLFLMKKGSKDLLNPGKWEVPGGKMEFGETCFETLKREVMEESGLNIEVGNRLTNFWQWTFKKGNGDENQIIAGGIVCRAITQNIDFSNQTQTDDLIEGKWVPIDMILNYDLIPNLVPTMQEFIKVYKELKLKGEPIFIHGVDQNLYNSDYTGDIKRRR